MRSIKDWTTADLYDLIDGEIQESISLEYKRSAALSKENHHRNELVKDVSAFANSAGGKLVYGINEEAHLPKSLDDGVGSEITREWIEQVLNSRIQPRIAGLMIKQIPLPNGRSAYVIDVPQATVLAPHQAGDKRYYKRFNYCSEPMEDYEVRDALRRTEATHLQLKFLVGSGTEADADGATALRLRARLTNLGEQPALYTAIVINIDERLFPESFSLPGWEITSGFGKVLTTGKEWPIKVLFRNIMPNNHMPIFKEQVWGVMDLTLKSTEGNDFVFGCKVVCPGFSYEKIGLVELRESGLQVSEDMMDLFEAEH